MAFRTSLRLSLNFLGRKPFRSDRTSRLLVKGFRTSETADSTTTVELAVSSALDRSHSHAAASISGMDDFYGSGGPKIVPAELDPTVAEIKDCNDVVDVLDIIEEEADLLEAEAVAAALLRCTLLVRANKKNQRAAYVSFTKQPGFAKLISLIERKAPDFSAKDLAQVVWAFATINHKNLRVLRLLAAAMDARVQQMNAQDLSTSVWSMGTLRFHPGAVLNSLATAAVPHIKAFQPKGLSMMLWGYARLEHQPPPEFMTRLLDQFSRKMDGFGPQAVSNIMYSLAKLGHFPRLRVCQAVERLVASSAQSFKCLELSNLLWALVQFRYQPTVVLQVVESRAQQENNGAAMEGQQWGTLVWGSAQLGMTLQDSTLEALETWGLRDMSSLTPLTLCNMLWGLALLGRADHPAFARLLEAVIASHQQRFLEPRLMRQVFQAATIARALGTPTDLPADLETTAHKWWRKATVGKPISLAHARVAKLVRQSGVQASTQHQTGEGMPSVDLAIEAPDGRQIALQVIGPYELAVNTQAPLGRQVSDRRLLEALGWEVIVMDITKLPSSHLEKKSLQAIAGHLSAFGIYTNIDTEHGQAQISRHEARKQSSPAAQPQEGVNGHARAMSDSRRGSEGAHSRRAAELNGASLGRRTSEMPVEPSLHATDLQTDIGNTEILGQRDVAALAEGNANGWDKAAGPLNSTGVVSKVEKEGEPSTAGLADESSASEKGKTGRQEAADKAAVEWDTVDGDFMSGWTSLADWRSARTVEPAKR